MSAAIKSLSSDAAVAVVGLLSSKFDPFIVTDVTYKNTHGHPIDASILVPKSIERGKHPLTIRWHGGFLVTGHRLFGDWYPQFVVDYTLKHGAIAITVDYRLMPEAKGTDILQDVKDFFGWLLEPGNLQTRLPEGIEVDLDNILVTGESAGGYLAFESAVLFPQIVRAVMMHYPMLDLRSPHFTKAYPKQLFDPPAPEIPEQVLADYLAKLNGDEVVTAATPPARVPLVLSMLQQGRTEEFLGTDRSLYPIEQLEDRLIPTALPPMWILHGKQDSVVPIEGTHAFLEKLKLRMPDIHVHVSLQEGEHGFDNHEPGTGEAASLETRWVKDGVNFIERFWPVYQ